MADFVTYSNTCIQADKVSNGHVIGTTGGLSDSYKASYNAGHNTLKITFTVKEGQSLSVYQARITKGNEDYDVDLGVRAAYLTNLAGGSTHTVSIAVNNTNFSKGDGVYRISLYAQRSLDYTWDVTYLFCVLDADSKFIPQSADGLEVVSGKQI